MFKLSHTTNIVFYKQLLQVCKSWEDYLWAFYRVMVDVRVEQVGIDPSRELKTFRQKRVYITVKQKEIEPLAVGVCLLYLNHNLSMPNDSVLKTCCPSLTTSMTNYMY